MVRWNKRFQLIHVSKWSASQKENIFKAYSSSMQNHRWTHLNRCWTRVNAILMDHLQVMHQICWSISPASFPSSHRECFTRRTDCDRSLPHIRQCANANVFIVIVDHPLVYLVRYTEDVVFLAEVSDFGQFRTERDVEIGVSYELTVLISKKEFVSLTDCILCQVDCLECSKGSFWSFRWIGPPIPHHQVHNRLSWPHHRSRRSST